MIIFLYGKDTYRIKEKLGSIIKEYQKKNSSGLNIRFFEEKMTFKDIEDEDKQISMFNEKRLFVIKNVFSSEKIKEDILKNYEKISSSESIFIFYQEGEVKKKEKLMELFAKEKIQEFTPLTSKKLVLWIKEEFLKNNAEVEEDAIYCLSEMVGDDLWRLKNEVDKLSLYGGKITRKKVEELVKGNVTTNIFETIEAIAKKDRKKALFLFYDHLEKGDNLQYILSMIVYQFRNLVIVRDLIEKNYSYNEIMKKSGLHHFVFKKTYDQANKFSSQELEDIYDKLFSIDLKTKTGQVDPALAIHLFLFGS